MKLACVAVLATTMPLAAQHMQAALPGACATPLRAIAVASVAGRLVPTSAWTAVSRTRSGDLLIAAFDAFGGDAAGLPTGFCTSGCSQNGWCPSLPETTRWWGGMTFRSPLSTNDMRPAPGTQARAAIRSQVAWWWAHPAPTRCFVAVLTGDNFATCPSSSPPVSGNLGGIVVDFGELAEGGGYQWSDIDLRGTGLAWQLPEDGSYTVMLGTAYDPGSGVFVLDPTWGTQPMRWGNGNRPGSSGPMQWDDWRNANGVIEWNECSYYDDVAHCPRPQGAMVSFWVGQTCYANCDASTAAPVLTSNDFLCFLNAYAGSDLSANCDGSSGVPALTPNDFQCFLARFAAGCS